MFSFDIGAQSFDYFARNLDQFAERLRIAINATLRQDLPPLRFAKTVAVANDANC